MGQHGWGTTNDNGEWLIYFCHLNNFVIGGTLFAHKEIHKLTWISPNQRVKIQIDHILIRKGTDVDSNHHLFVAHIKMKLKRTETLIRLLIQFNVSKLKNACIRQQSCNRFAALDGIRGNRHRRKQQTSGAELEGCCTHRARHWHWPNACFKAVGPPVF